MPSTPQHPQRIVTTQLRRLVMLVVASQMLLGCASTRCAPGRAQVESDLRSRAERALSPSQCGETQIPLDVVLDDGVTADEAVAVALWNNSAFNATLTQLGMARGDLVQAGLLKNPQFQILLPGGTKQLEWALFFPIDAFLLRETRLDLSEQEVCRVAQELVQNGLNVVRDTRVAHADLVFAVDRAALADEAVDVRSNIADLTQKQLDAGDISDLEATTAKIDFLRAKAEAAGLRHAVTQAQARLSQLMGIGTWNTQLHPIAENFGLQGLAFDLESLTSEATSCRPDLRAAMFAVEAAKKRADVSRWQWLKLDLVADANSGGAGNTNFGPGFRLDIPIFDRNQGGILTADWAVNQASQNYNAVRDQVVMEVQTAHSQVQQATENLAILQADVLTSLQEALHLAGKAYADGGAAYFLVLQTTSQYLDARTRELELVANLQKAHANLDRSVGRRLQSPELSIQSPEPVDSPEFGGPNPETSSVLPPESELSSLDPSAPNILIISEDGSSLFSGDAMDERIGEKLRQIAAELDTMITDSSKSDNQTTSKVSFAGAVTTGWHR